MNNPTVRWDEIDAQAEREAKHVPGHHNKRMRYRSGLERAPMSDAELRRRLKRVR